MKSSVFFQEAISPEYFHFEFFFFLTRMKCLRRLFINETSERATVETVSIKRLMILCYQARNFDKFYDDKILKARFFKHNLLTKL